MTKPLCAAQFQNASVRTPKVKFKTCILSEKSPITSMHHYIVHKNISQPNDLVFICIGFDNLSIPNLHKGFICPISILQSLKH